MRARINIKVGNFDRRVLYLFYALRHLLRISELGEMLHFPRKKEAGIFGVYAVKQ